MLHTFDREVIHPADDDPDHTIPERHRQYGEENRIRDMFRPEPPVEETKRCGDTRSCKDREYDPVDAANRWRPAPSPERFGHTLIFQLGARWRKRYVKLSDPLAAR
jgi:hypothetical protein